MRHSQLHDGLRPPQTEQDQEESEQGLPRLPRTEGQM